MFTNAARQIGLESCRFLSSVFLCGVLQSCADVLRSTANQFRWMAPETWLPWLEFVIRYLQLGCNMDFVAWIHEESFRIVFGTLVFH